MTRSSGKRNSGRKGNGNGKGKATPSSSASTTDEVPAAMFVSTKYLEERYDADGYTHITEPGSGPPKKPKEDKWNNYVLCMTRHFNTEQKYSHRTLEIKSPQLKSVLKRIIGEYPGVSFRTEKISLGFPLCSLYHYMDELREEKDKLVEKQPKDGEKVKENCAEKKKDEEKKVEAGGKKTASADDVEETNPEDDVQATIEHLEFLINFLEDEFKETISECKNLIPEGLITYPLLWTILRPGKLIYTTISGQPRVLRLVDTTEVGGNMPHLSVEVCYIDYDGATFGHSTTNVIIFPFAGSQKINELAGFPLSFHPREASIRKTLIERGRKFESLKGSHYREYKGIGLGEVVRCRRLKYNINGRVMIDMDSFGRFNPDRAITVKSINSTITELGDDDSYGYGYDSDDETEEKEELPVIPLTDEQALMATSTVAGFALAEKKWVDFYIDNISPIQWNENAFEHLVLPAAQKSLVRALVESHVKEKSGFDDVIKGKGKGLISVLFGPAGVGKTLTAESVAEHTRRPLYVVSSGELGDNPYTLEENLAKILDMATVWKAVLLLDEADVFLEERSLDNLTRNSLVSIFLRLLEYYQGILFLTSNRVATFDEAFQSRIHIALKYHDLDKPARRSVWKNFLERMLDEKDATTGENAVVVKEGDYDILSERPLNGRQIKNCIKTARSLAESEGKPMGLKELEMVLNIQKDFEKEFKELRSG